MYALGAAVCCECLCDQQVGGIPLTNFVPSIGIKVGQTFSKFIAREQRKCVVFGDPSPVPLPMCLFIPCMLCPQVLATLTLARTEDRAPLTLPEDIGALAHPHTEEWPARLKPHVSTTRGAQDENQKHDAHYIFFVDLPDRGVVVNKS